MIFPSNRVRIVVATRPVDFRIYVERAVMRSRRQDPFTGTVFLFRAKRSDRLKLVFYDGTGLVMIYKRLEEQGFVWPAIRDGVMTLRADLLALACAVLDRRLAGAHQIAHRLMGFVGRPDLGQFAGTEQTRQLHRIAAVRLHPLARPARDQGRSDDGAFVTELLDQPLQAVARRPRLVAEAKPCAGPFELAHQTAHGGVIRSDLPVEPDLAVATAIRHRDGMAILRNVHANENFATVHHGSPSWLEVLLLEQPSLKAASVGRTALPQAGRRRTYSLTLIGFGGSDMRNVFAATLTALLLVCTDSWAQVADEPKRTMPHQEVCAVPLPTDFWDDSAAEPFRSAEIWAWNERICLGRWADMRNAPGGDGHGEECEAAKIEDMEGAVPAHRELRPEFLELILSHEPWASAQRHPEVGIRCALVRGDVYLDGHEIAPRVRFERSEIDGRLNLVGTKFKRSLSLYDSTVTGKLSADRMKVGDDLSLSKGSFTDIHLFGAKVAGSARFEGSTVTGELSMDRLKVGGDLSLSKGSFADIALLGAKVAGTMDLIGTTVTGKLSADGLEVGGDLFLREHSTFADIRLPGARIGGDVQLSGSTFHGEFNLTGAAIGGELHLSSGWRKDPPTWQNGASLILRNAKANALQAQRDSWEISGTGGLLTTDLTGFVFNQLGGLDVAGGANMGDEPARWLIDWIEAQRDHGKHYDPQPYTQLAQVLNAAGATEKARSIRYAKFEHKLNHDKSMGTFRSIVLSLKRYFVGYGVYPFWALYWFFGLVMVGGLLAQCSKDASVRRWMGPWYSLENALPFIERNERFRNVAHGHTGLVHFFHFQKAFGFVLATVLVGALTLLGG